MKGFGLMEFLTVVFVVLKLCSVIAWLDSYGGRTFSR